MTNPIIVFFDKTKVVDSWEQYTGPLPIGWIKDITTCDDPRKTPQILQVLVLDDTMDVSESRHENKNANEPLLIIKHNSSGKHNDPENNATLKTWGRPITVGGFSHSKGNVIFEQIRKLLEKQIKAEDFVESWRNAIELGALIELAAICQIKMLNAESDVNALYNQASARLPSTSRGALSKLTDTEGNPKWEDQLIWVRKTANALTPE